MYLERHLELGGSSAAGSKVVVGGPDSSTPTHYEDNATNDAVLGALNKVGKDGWELVGVEKWGASTTFWLRRPTGG